MMDTLGCGDYTVIAQTRGGARQLGEIPWQQVNAGRVVDGISNATVSLPISGKKRTECCFILSEIDCYEHELAIWRDRKEIWTGPITDINWSKDQASISGKDLNHWFERREFQEDRGSDADLAFIFEEYVDMAMEEDPSPNIILRTKETGIRGKRIVKAGNRTRIWDGLIELARTGLDFTAAGGRNIYAGGLEILFDRPLQVWQSAIRVASVHKRGLNMATRVSMIGKPPGSNGVPISAVAGGVSSKYGLLERRFTEPLIEDEGSMLEAAHSRLALIQTPPKYLTISFSPDSQFGYQDIIPGRRADVAIEVECVEVIEQMRIQSVAVNVAATNKGGVSESIDGTIIPLGVVEN